MDRFECDYSEGCLPEILQALTATNYRQTPGYGEDEISAAARELLREACGLTPESCDVHLMIGGTQTNVTVIASLLRPYQGVISADTGHINVHESGAVESTGHKVLAVPTAQGKLTAEDVRRLCRDYAEDVTRDHIVQPAMVYVSWPTESGLLYTKAELTAISQACRELGLPLYLDGARMGYGLASPECDLTLPELAALCDIFYIGGTKQGALFGEALVFTKPSLSRGFRSMMKNKAGMLAKGRLLGLQFQVLFTDKLYFRAAAHADAMAMKIAAAFREKGCPFLFPSPTNQQFPILPDAWLERLAADFAFSYWKRVDENHSAVRFCTSWATQEAAVDRLIAAIQAL